MIKCRYYSYFFFWVTVLPHVSVSQTALIPIWLLLIISYISPHASTVTTQSDNLAHNTTETTNKPVIYDRSAHVSDGHMFKVKIKDDIRRRKHGARTKALAQIDWITLHIWSLSWSDGRGWIWSRENNRKGGHVGKVSEANRRWSCGGFKSDLKAKTRTKSKE